MKCQSWLRGAALLTTLLWTIDAPHAQAPAPGTAVQTELDELVKAAKAEGQLLFYTSATANIAARTADAFAAKYGIKANFVRLVGKTLYQRFSSEADGGIFAADLIFVIDHAEKFASDGAKKGWIEAVTKAGLPVVRSGEYPARFMYPHVAVVQIQPWVIGYNSEKLKNPPKSWSDLVNPDLKTQILVADPKAADTYYDIWALLLERYGESYFAGLRKQEMRVYASGVPAMNALGAGEGFVSAPASPAALQGMIEKGAPLGIVIPEVTTGFEMKLMLTARDKTKHPNAARLFANYVLSPEGNKVFNADPGSYSVYDLSALPKGYVSPDPEALAARDKIDQLLGMSKTDGAK